MTPEVFCNLNVAKFEVRLQAHESVTLPPFLGSTLRGAFGHALKEAVSMIDGCECTGCSAADPCAYHYLFETPVPPGIAQLRGQREAPVPFILSPPIVENPVRRVWRVPLANAVPAAARTLSHDSQFAMCDSQSSPVGDVMRLNVPVRNIPPPRSSIRNPQSTISSVVFPDQPKRIGEGDELIYDLTLLVRAINYSSHIVIAIKEMARRGLGATRARFELKEVWMKSAVDAKEPIWANGASLRALSSPLPQCCHPLSKLIRERLAALRGPSEQTSRVPAS